MLGEWVCGWSARHESGLAKERTLIRVRAARQTFFVTAAEAEGALGRTHDELYLAFQRRPDWGVDEVGRPSALAVGGLATRRLADRLRDALRARNGAALAEDIDGGSEEGVGARVATSRFDGVDDVITL